MSDNDVLEARDSFVCDVGGRPYTVIAGVTRITSGHELNKHYPQHFRPVAEGLTYELEQATDNPEEVRNRPIANAEGTGAGQVRPGVVKPGPPPSGAGRTAAKTTTTK